MFRIASTAFLVVMPMTVNAAEVCRSYSKFLPEEPGLTFTISADGVLIEDEDFSEQATCVGNVCADTFGSFIVEKEVPGEYAIINGERMDAICDQ